MRAECEVTSVKFIETNKHRQIEQDAMELAMSWYYRYTEKLEQMEEIDRRLREFEEWMMSVSDYGTVSVSELERVWEKTIQYLR